MNKYYIILALFIIITMPIQAWAQSNEQPDTNYINLEKVSFVDFHDPGWIILKNEVGEEYIADFYYDFIEYKDIDTWSSNENLTITISEDKGIGIVREKTNQFYKLFFRKEHHPIEIKLKKCRQKGPMTDCFLDAANHWKVEADFAFSYFLKRLKDKQQQENLIKSQEAWYKYRESIVNSYIEIPNYEGGTYGLTLAAKFYMVLDRSRYYDIAHFYE